MITLGLNPVCYVLIQRGAVCYVPRAGAYPGFSEGGGARSAKQAKQARDWATLV